MNSTATIFARLKSQTAITDALDVRNGEPAIFNDRAPDDFVFGSEAAIVIGAPDSDLDGSTFTERVRVIGQAIRIYGRDDGSSADIDALARDVRDAFDNQQDSLTVTGGKCIASTATGPTGAPTTDPSLIGRRVTLRLELQET